MSAVESSGYSKLRSVMLSQKIPSGFGVLLRMVWVMAVISYRLI